MAPDFHTVLLERRARVEGTAQTFESQPAESQADASYLRSPASAAAAAGGKTRDWLLQVELLAERRQALPGTADVGTKEPGEGPPRQRGGGGAAAAAAAVAAATAAADAAARAGLAPAADGLVGGYFARADGASGEVADAVREAAVLFSIAEGHLDDEDGAKALEAASAAEKLFLMVGDWGGVVDALQVQLGGRRLLGKPEEALRLAEERLEAFCAAGDKRGEAAMLLCCAEARLSAGTAPPRGRLPGDDETGATEEATRLAERAGCAAQEAGDMRLQMAALLALSRAHLGGDMPEEALRACHAALRLARGSGRKCEARARHQLAEAHLSASRFQEAKQQAKDAQRLFQELGARREEGSELLLLADVHLALEEPAEAQRCAGAALELFGAAGLARGREAALRKAVEAHLALEDAQGAVRIAEAALAASREAGDSRGELAALDALVVAHVGVDRLSPQHAPADALRAAQEALAICRYLGDRRREAATLQTVAEMQVLNGQRAGAAAGLEQALELLRELRDARGEAAALLALAGARLAAEPRRALSEAKEARRLLEEAGEQRKVPTALLMISNIHRALGESDKAVASASMAREACQAVGDKAGEADCWLAVAAARLDSGEEAAALRAAREAQALLQDPCCKRERQALEDILHWMAGLHFHSAEPEEALKLAKKGESVLRRKRTSTDHEKARMKLLSAHAKLELLWRVGLEQGPESKKLRREFEGALRTAELAVRLARPVGDGHLLASALHALGHVYWYGSRHTDALRVTDEAAVLLRECNDTMLEIRNLALLAQAQDAAGDRDVASRLLDRALELAQESTDAACMGQVAALQEELLGAPPALLAPEPLALGVAEDALPDAPPEPSPAPQVPEDTFAGPDEEMVTKSIFALAQSISGGEEAVDGDTPLMDAGLDSLSSVDLRNRLQQEFGLTLSSTVIFNFPTVRLLARHLVEECTAKRIPWGRN